MSWRRKRSKGSRTNPVKGAGVINKGGGGGDMPVNKPALETLAARRAMQREAKRLDAETSEDRERREKFAEYMEKGKRQRRNGRSKEGRRSLRIVKPGTEN
jgi:hypothetical protein